MTQRHSIGVDVGSQGAKGVLLDPDGRVVGTARHSYSMTHPAAGWAEQDANDWRAGVTAVVCSLLASSGVDPREVGFLGLACQVDGVVPVDRGGEPLRNAIIWLDRRATAQSQRLGDAVGEAALFARTGLNVDASHCAPKMMWLRDEEPAVYGAAAALPPTAGYLCGWLTGRTVIDRANASSSLLYDLATGDWDDRLVSAAGLDRGLLPEIGSSTDVAGTLTTDAAVELGLTTGCMVVVGTGDDHAASLAAGLSRPGVIADITGTAEPVAAMSREIVLDSSRLVETHAHCMPGATLLENPGFVSGGSTLWLSESVLQCEQESVFVLAEKVPAGSDGVVFLPALSGAMTPRWNSRMRGAFSGLAMNHSGAHLARAVLEGCAYALRDIVDCLDDITGTANEVRVVGGGTRSRTWLQIKADVLARPVRLVEVEEPTALGAALLAATAGGVFNDLADAVERTVRLDPDVIEPDDAAAAVYRDTYDEYRRLFDAVEGRMS